MGSKETKELVECRLMRLPGAMVVQILFRLPPKSLMRFKCIHKSWNSLINSRYFVAEHLRFHNNLSSSTTILLRRPVTSRNETRDEENQEIVFSLLTFCNDDNGYEGNLHYDIEDIHFPPSIGLKTRGQFIENPGQRWEGIKIVGHCDGIICLFHYAASDLVLYNPAIKEFKLIPKPCLPCLPCLRELHLHSDAFGYDPKSEDYIFVIVASSGENNYYRDRLVIDPLRAAMYTLVTDSWREIKIHDLETETSVFRPYYTAMYLKGKCYWLAQEIGKRFISPYDCLDDYYIREAIVWFDTSKGEFHSSELPDSLYEFPYHDFTLSIWNNCVALFGYDRGESRPFEIWAMGDSDGFTRSWVKHLSIDFTESPLLLVPLDANPSVLVSQRLQVVLYGFATKKYTYFPVYAADYFDAAPFLNSIVPFNS